MRYVRSNEETGRLVLQAFKHYAVSDGEPLLTQYITAYALLHDRLAIEVKAGLKYANDNHWIVRCPNGPVILTSEGFAALAEGDSKIAAVKKLVVGNIDDDVLAVVEPGLQCIFTAASKAGFSRDEVIHVLEAAIAKAKIAPEETC